MKMKSIIFFWAWLMPLLLYAQDGFIDIKVNSYYNPRTDFDQTTFKLWYSFDNVNYTLAPTAGLACYSASFPKNAWGGVGIPNGQKTFRLWTGASNLPTTFYIRLEGWGEKNDLDCNYDGDDGEVGRTIWTVNLAGTSPATSIRAGEWVNVWYAENNDMYGAGYPTNPDIDKAARRDDLGGGRWGNPLRGYDVEFEVRYTYPNPTFGVPQRTSGNVGSLCQGERFSQKLESTLNQVVPSTKGVDVSWTYRLETKYKQKTWTGTYEPNPPIISCGWRIETTEVNCRFENICTDPFDLSSCSIQRVCDLVDTPVPDCTTCPDPDSDLFVLTDGNGNYILDGNGNPQAECKKKVFIYPIVSGHVYGYLPKGPGESYYSGLLDVNGANPQKTTITLNDLDFYGISGILNTLQAQYNELETLVASKIAIRAEARYGAGSGWMYGIAPMLSQNLSSNWVEIGTLNYPPKPTFVAPSNNPLVSTETQKEVSNAYAKISNVLCKDGNQGKIEITRVDGFGKYYYSLRKQNGLVLSNQSSLTPLSASTPIVFSNLTAGNYELAIENYDVLIASGAPSFSTNGCFDIFNFTIGEPSKLAVKSIASPLKAAGNVNISCRGGSDGVIAVEAEGGVANYYFKLFKKDGVDWIHQVRPTDNIAQTKNFSFTGLSVGEYRVEIQDIFKASGCVVPSPSSVVLTEPTELTSSLSNNQLYQDAISGTFYDIQNFGGSQNILILPQGGSPTYQVQINGGTAVSVAAGNTASQSLAAGNHNYSVQDANGCLKTVLFSLSQPPIISLALQNVSHVSCFGGSDGVIEVAAQGGIRTSTYYTYTLKKPSDGSFLMSKTGTTSSALVSFSNLKAGNYTLEVVDRFNTVQSFPLVVTEPTAISWVTSSSHKTYVTCVGASDGVIALNLSGGVGPYTYRYNMNGGAWSSEQTVTNTLTINNLAAGNYTLEIQDSRKCYNDVLGAYPGFFAVNFSVAAPSSALNLVLTPEHLLCKGDNSGKIYLVGSGGWGNYSFFDAVTGAPVSTTISNLAAGIYQYKVRDVRGCEQIASMTLTEPLELVGSSITTTPTLCFGEASGSVSVVVNGGTAPYQISMDGGALVNYSSGVVIGGLFSGNHSLRLVDANNCEKTYAFNITDAPQILVSTLSQTPANCGLADGAVSIGVSGGTGTYSYLWRNSSNAVVGGNSATLSSVRSGAYTVVVKDANNCEKSYVAVVPSVDGPQGVINVVQTVSCFGGSDGVASISITGGQAPYSVLWANNQTSSGVTGTAMMSGLKAGSQIAQITDNRGCVEAVVFSISEPTPLVVQVVSTVIPTCFGGSDGSISVNATGGTAPYSYVWLDDNSSLATRSGLKKGSYEVKIKDANNCEIIRTIVLAEPEPVKATFREKNFTICPNQVLSLDAGNAGSSYVWKKVGTDTPVSSAQEALLTEAGDYELTITTPAGCVGRETFSVNISNDALKAEFLAATEIEVGDTLVTIDVTNPAPSEVIWSYDVSNPNIRRVDNETIPYYAHLVFDAPGTYVVTMQVKLFGCASTLQKTITVLPKTGRVVQPGLGYQGVGEISKLLVYPNPSGGVFSTRVELVKDSPVEVFLYGLQNRDSYFKRSLSGSKEYDVEVNLPYLPAGNYVLVVKTPQMTKTQTIVISK